MYYFFDKSVAILVVVGWSHVMRIHHWRMHIKVIEIFCLYIYLLFIDHISNW